ncbi:MAG: tRNA (N6-threonylcarbamoyladenosine(37)-N6)-methyltransferase TrmO [Deltaproteobacteria bacterium]|nr:tRNA (N6-threonylcarbamoyladenosine(37)-N6)-methyltransferase TrmO [Deltaproteobacteria bacterium]
MSHQDKEPRIAENEIEKLKVLIPHWIDHNDHHIHERERWLKTVEDSGLYDVAHELKHSIELAREENRRLALAKDRLQDARALQILSAPGASKSPDPVGESIDGEPSAKVELKAIGVIHTPYTTSAPYQPLSDDEGDFRIVIDPRYESGLDRLSAFRYIYVLYFVHRAVRDTAMLVSPPWAGGAKLGVFASRSPVRPNRIGLSVVQVKRIERNIIITTGLDAFDGTPVLDIKPYIKDLDSKSDANYGWIEGLDDFEHLLMHIKGTPHHY